MSILDISSARVPNPNPDTWRVRVLRTVCVDPHADDKFNYLIYIYITPVGVPVPALRTNRVGKYIIYVYIFMSYETNSYELTKYINLYYCIWIHVCIRIVR